MEEHYSNHDQRRSENTTWPSRSFLCDIPQALAPTSSSSVYGDRTISSAACHHRDNIAFRLESSSSNRCLVSELALQSVNKSEASDEDVDSLKAKIISHPLYFNLFEAYMECQKVGAPPHVLEQMTARKNEFEKQWQSQASKRVDLKDPELDRFMEAYYNKLVKYREELARPLKEAMEFMRRIESELNTIGYGDAAKCFYSGDDDCGGGDDSSEDQQNGGGEALLSGTDRQKGDVELKNHLLKKYGGHLSGLKKEFSKKKKKGKLPKEAKQKLLTWWDLHYKWPYPSETEKAAFVESTGLDQKQINNWFINQRKRHWKPSEVMQQLTVEDDLHPQNNVALYVNGHHIGLQPYC